MATTNSYTNKPVRPPHSNRYEQIDPNKTYHVKPFVFNLDDAWSFMMENIEDYCNAAFEQGFELQSLNPPIRGDYGKQCFVGIFIHTEKKETTHE